MLKRKIERERERNVGKSNRVIVSHPAFMNFFDSRHDDDDEKNTELSVSDVHVQLLSYI